MIDINSARDHFKKTDQRLFGITKNVTDIKAPQKMPDKFYARELFSSIVSQQLSTKAAATIWRRLCELVGNPGEPQTILKYSQEQLRSVGLSNQKAKYILAIAEGITSQTVRLDHLDKLDDEAVIEELTQLKGIGRWTAEMFLIFTLARPDVFSIGDLGLRNAADQLYGKKLPLSKLQEISAKWSPHRSAACLFLWHSLDNKPS